MSLKTGELEPRIFTRKVTFNSIGAEQRIELPPFRCIVWNSIGVSWSIAFGDGDFLEVNGSAWIRLPSLCSVIRVRHDAGAGPDTVQLWVCEDPAFEVGQINW